MTRQFNLEADTYESLSSLAMALKALLVKSIYQSVVKEHV
jgi:hypothetical protein